MRLVLDTNVVVAALLYGGTPNRLLDAVISEKASTFTSPVLIAELRRVLRYQKLAPRLTTLGVAIDVLVERYEHLAGLVYPPEVPRVVPADPDDDHVLACALAARADLIVSGDKDLLSLKAFQGIPIATPAEALSQIARV